MKRLHRQRLRALALTNVLVVILGCLAVCFISSATIVESGLGLSTSAACHGAFIICLAFYVSCKVAMWAALMTSVCIDCVRTTAPPCTY